MATSSQLFSRLSSLDGKSYGALKSLAGTWDFGGFRLCIDKVQSDPYAPASRMHLVLDRAQTKLPVSLTQTRQQRLAAADFIARDIFDAVRQGPREFGFVAPGQEILARSSVLLSETEVQVRFTFQFPAAGRRVKGRLAAQLLVDELPNLVRYSALGEELDLAALDQHVQTYTDYLALQAELPGRGLVAFIADGALLPRATGASDLPLSSGKLFSSPASLRVSFDLPSGRQVTGMGIPTGLTLLVGGGFHGKSTLLRALERGVYSHIPGDGRELVVTDPSAISVRAEDGRAVTGTDISPFISKLPGGVDTSAFSTTNASGSTSQAANLAEALEIGASTLLIDEDTSATNFMIRDSAMKALIASEHEPITPFVDRVSDLYSQLGVSTILVMGGSGAFFSQADRVIALQDYLPSDVTAQAGKIASSFGQALEGQDRPSYDFSSYLQGAGRRVAASSLRPSHARKPARARGLEQIQLGKENLDLRYLAQLVDASQTQALALSLELLAQELESRKGLLAESIKAVCQKLESEGLDLLVGAVDRAESKRVRGDLALPRAAELHQAVSRWRGLRRN